MVPRHVGRAEFFTELYDILKSDPRTSEIVAVPDAYVPVMKMVYDSIDIDLLFARLALPSIPKTLDLLDDQYLKNLDEKVKTIKKKPMVQKPKVCCPTFKFQFFLSFFLFVTNISKEFFENLTNLIIDFLNSLNLF